MSGVLLIRTGEINAHIDSKWSTKEEHSEPNAIRSSADKDLFDQMTLLGLYDMTLENQQCTLPISDKKLEQAWSHPDVVAITPIDDGIGVNLLMSWIATLEPTWIPVLTLGDNAFEVVETSERVGIAITDQIARMWGSGNDEDLFETRSGSKKAVNLVSSNAIAIAATDLTPGSTVSNKNSEAVLVAPTF